MSGVHQKVTAGHLSRDAYLYVRQSTVRQVFEHAESTRRQYALRERAVALDVALQVQDELAARAEEADLWRAQRVQRAREEADLARQRFMQAHPDNRMVADVLEAEWNAKLRALDEAQHELERGRAEPGQARGWKTGSASGSSHWPATSPGCGTIRRRRTASASGWRGC